MKVTKEVKSPTKVVLSVSAAAAELEPIKRHVLSHFAKDVKVPGFRAGKAPAHMIEKSVNQKAMLDEFMEHALNDLYGRAIDSEKLRPAAAPKVELKKFVPYTLLEFEAEIEVIGPVKLPDYKAIKLARKPVSVTAKDVDDVIASLRQRSADRAEVERAAKLGDEVIIDFSGRDSKGQPIAGADGKDYPLVLGSKTFIPGFEEHILGVKSGEDKEFAVTFPADYGVSALKSKKVTFNVSVKKINELKEPKADDELAAKVGPFKNLGELKADIKKQLLAERQSDAQREYENELIKLITDKSSIDVPDSLVEDQILRSEEEEKRNLTYRGQTWQEHLKEEGVSEQQHRDRFRPEAAERVKAGLVLSEIAEKENIEVGKEELENRIQALKGQYQDPGMQEQLNDPNNRRDVAARLMTEKTIARLVEHSSHRK